MGMGPDLFEVRPDLLGERSDQILGCSLREMCLEGPEEALTRTEHAQPALFALSYALWDILAETLPSQPAGAAGHSLGEYTALTASGALGYEAALGVVARRGKAMATALWGGTPSSALQERAAAPIFGTVPRTSPVAGLVTSMVAPLSASAQAPSI